MHTEIGEKSIKMAFGLDSGWVFISHSHRDISSVRVIRNLLEERGFEPLLFYLKCLSDSDEIEGLIKREIDEREWFIYVDSNNARQSKWVKSERDYIKTLSGKKVFTIDLNKPVEEQVIKIARQLKVFISYAHADTSLMQEIEKKLQEHDFLVFHDFLITKETISWFDQTKTMIQQSSREGFVLLLISKNTMDSKFVRDEVGYAKQQEGMIIPVCVDDVALTDDDCALLGGVSPIHIHSNATDEELEKVITTIQGLIDYRNPY